MEWWREKGSSFAGTCSAFCGRCLPLKSTERNAYSGKTILCLANVRLWNDELRTLRLCRHRLISISTAAAKPVDVMKISNTCASSRPKGHERLSSLFYSWWLRVLIVPCIHQWKQMVSARLSTSHVISDDSSHQRFVNSGQFL